MIITADALDCRRFSALGVTDGLFSGPIRRVGMGWKADPVEFLGCRLPLHEMQRVDVVAFKAIPDVFPFSVVCDQ